MTTSKKVFVCCLKRILSESKDFKYIILENKSELVIGRSMDVDCAIPSNMISRRHAILQKSESGRWTIMDNNSLNGIFINGIKLKPMDFNVLEDGDMIQLGIAINDEKPAEFIWQFFLKLPLKKYIRGDHDKSQGIDQDCSESKRYSPNFCMSNVTCTSAFGDTLLLDNKTFTNTGWSPGTSYRQKLNEQDEMIEKKITLEAKRLKKELENSNIHNCDMEMKLKEAQAELHRLQSKCEENLCTEQQLQEQKEKLDKLQKELLEKDRLKEETKLKEEELARLQNELQARIAAEEFMKEKEKQLEMELKRKHEVEEQLQKLQEELAKRDEANSELAAKMRAKEEEQQRYLQSLQDELLAQKLEAEEQLRQEYEQQIAAKEQELLQQLSDEKERLTVERLAVEKSLHREMEKKLEDQNEKLQESLKDEKIRLEKIIEQRDCERKMLEAALTQEVAKEKETALQVKEDLLANFASLLEMELQCSICNELFIKATSLSCSHSFCEFCIDQWMAMKKDCPVCRAPVSSRYRSVVLDSYIEKMVEHLNDEMKQKRRIIIQERQAEQERAAVKRAKPAEPEIILIDSPLRNPELPRRNNQHDHRGRNRRHNQQGATNVRQNIAVRTQADNVPQQVNIRPAQQVTGVNRTAPIAAGIQRPDINRPNGANGQRIMRPPPATSNVTATRNNAATFANARQQTAPNNQAGIRPAAVNNQVVNNQARLTAVIDQAGTGVQLPAVATSQAGTAARLLAVINQAGTGARQPANNIQTRTATHPIVEESAQLQGNGPQDVAALREAVVAAVAAATGVQQTATGNGFLIVGDQNAYYPGWGICHNCGFQGHWANGCPFRNNNNQ